MAKHNVTKDDMAEDKLAQAYDIIIVGAGHAGAACAINLRKHKFEGSILIIGDEPDLPYERPPLSKDYLAQAKSFERLLIRPEDFWTKNTIHIRRNTRVTVVDPGAHHVTCDGGETIRYQHLVWAAGGAARAFPGPGGSLPGVHTVRTRGDVDQIMAELPNAENIVVIGGGYIGLEAAAVMRKFDKSVVLLEAQERVLARVAGADLSRFFEKEHRDHGVDIRLGQSITAIEGQSHVTGVSLAGGETLDAQMVIVGIGILPATAPLHDAGAQGENGVLIDEQCRTSLPDIFAIGDCALHPNGFADGAAVRLESVQNAHDQAAVVAKIITGQDTSYQAIPWFWSDQYDLKLQTIGLSAGHDQTVLRGDVSARSFSIAYLKAGRVIAFDCVNCPKDYVQGRKLITERVVVDPQQLANPDIALPDLIP